jgi:hypothetical protein
MVTPAYVDCLRRAANGEQIPEEELTAARHSAGASPARFARDIRHYCGNPQGYHEAARRHEVAYKLAPPQPHSKKVREKDHWDVAFGHGLGDNCQAIALFTVFRKHGWNIRVHVGDDKRWLWRAAGFELLDEAIDADVTHPWPYHASFRNVKEPDWDGNKTGSNLHSQYLPDIGSREKLWPELCATRPDVRTAAGDVARADVAKFFADLPRPIVLLHHQGSSWSDQKSMELIEVMQFYKLMLEQCPGSVVLLDWSGGGPIAHDEGASVQRVRRAPQWSANARRGA